MTALHQIKPLAKNILIQVHELDQTAMILVDEKEAQIEKATILEIGDEVTLVKKGDVIFFKDYDVDRIVEGTETYTLITEENLRAICTPTTTEL